MEKPSKQEMSANQGKDVWKRMGYTQVTRVLRPTSLGKMVPVAVENVDWENEETGNLEDLTEIEETDKSEDLMEVRADDNHKQHYDDITEQVKVTGNISELSKSGKPQSFIMNGHFIKIAHVKEVPNTITRQSFDGLKETAKEELKEMLVGRYYDFKQDYVEMNNRLVELYGLDKTKHYCAICVHLGLPILHHKGNSWPSFSTKYKLDQHYTRIHFAPFECIVCGKLFVSSKSLRSHKNSQSMKQSKEYRIDEQKVLDVEGLSARELVKNWRAADVAAKKARQEADKAKRLAFKAAAEVFQRNGMLRNKSGDETGATECAKLVADYSPKKIKLEKLDI